MIGGAEDDATEAVLRIRAVPGTARHRLQPGVELAEVEGLHQVVVRSCLQPRDPVADLVMGGQDDDGPPVRSPAQGAQEVEPIAVRQTQIQQQERVVGRMQKAPRVLERDGTVHRMPTQRQVVAQHLPKRRIVFDQKNSHDQRRGRQPHVRLRP